jgi:hypothetical protein
MSAEARAGAPLTVAQLQALYAIAVDSHPEKVITNPCHYLRGLVAKLIASSKEDFASALERLRGACALASALVAKQSLTLPSFVRAVEDHLDGLAFESIQGRLCAILHTAGRGAEVLAYRGAQDDLLHVGDLLVAVDGVSLVNFPVQVCTLFLRGAVGTCKRITLLRDGVSTHLDVSLEHGQANDFTGRLRQARVAADTRKLVTAARVQLQKGVATALRQAYGSREHRRSYAPNKFKYTLHLDLKPDLRRQFDACCGDADFIAAITGDVSERLRSIGLDPPSHKTGVEFEVQLLREWEGEIDMTSIHEWMEEVIFDAPADQHGFCLKAAEVVDHVLFREILADNVSDYVASNAHAVEFTLLASVLGGGDGGSVGRRDFTHFTLALMDTWEASARGETLFRELRPVIFHNLMGVREHEKRALDCSVHERARNVDSIVNTVFSLQLPGSDTVHSVKLKLADAARADSPYLGQVMGVRYMNAQFKSGVDGSATSEINDRDPVISKVLTIGDREELYAAKDKFMRLETAKISGLSDTARKKQERALRGKARLLFCNTMHLPDLLAAQDLLSSETRRQVRAATARHDPLHAKTNTIRRWWYMARSLASDFSEQHGRRIPTARTVGNAREQMSKALKDSAPGSNRAIDDMHGVDWEKFLRRHRAKAVGPWAGDCIMAAGDVLELAVSMVAAGRQHMMQGGCRAMRAFITLWQAEVFPALLSCTAPSGKFSEIGKIKCIHNQIFSLMPPAQTCGLDDTAQHTEGAVKLKRQSLKACGSSSKAAHDCQLVQNAAIVDALGSRSSADGNQSPWPQAILLPWCAVCFRYGSCTRYYATAEQLDDEARRFVFTNPERPGILVVGSESLRAQAASRPSWDGSPRAKVLCCAKHHNHCDHAGAAADQAARGLTLQTYLEEPYGFPVFDEDQIKQQLRGLGFLPKDDLERLNTPALFGAAVPARNLTEDVYVCARPWFGEEVMAWYRASGTQVPTCVQRVRDAYLQVAISKGMSTLPDALYELDLEDVSDEETPQLQVQTPRCALPRAPPIFPLHTHQGEIFSPLGMPPSPSLPIHP